MKLAHFDWFDYAHHKYTQYKQKGFTLIELLVVIAIIAILSVVGVVVFRSVTGGARDAARKADVDAIAKAMEVQFSSSGSYQQPQDANFASGKKPKTPQGGDYTVLLSSDNSSFRVCAPLESNLVPTCGASNGSYCYCTSSNQGSFVAGSGGSGYIGHPTSCDQGQSLGVGLVGYWKMDEGIGTTVADFSGRGNNGTVQNGVNWQNGAACTSGGCLLFPNNKSDHVTVPISNSSSLNLGTSDFTVSGWVTIANTVPTNLGTGIFGRYGHTDSYLGNYVIGFDDSSNHNPFFSYRKIGTLFTVSYYSYTSYWGNKTLITWVKSGNNLLLYLNGGSPKLTTNVSSWGININFYGNGSTYFISNTGWAPGSWSNVVVDEHRIYNRALSQGEVTNLYNGGAGCI